MVSIRLLHTLHSTYAKQSPRPNVRVTCTKRANRMIHSHQSVVNCRARVVIIVIASSVQLVVVIVVGANLSSPMGDSCEPISPENVYYQLTRFTSNANARNRSTVVGTVRRRRQFPSKIVKPHF